MNKQSLKNAKTLPKVFYGLHMCPGVAEYSEPGTEPYRIMIGENAIKNMDPTFQGRPVYVRHVDEVDLENIQKDADGYVVESFFNQADGKHWVKFIAVSDKAHEAIRSGWKLSNAYIPKEMSGGGLWHGVEYAKEVMRGEYEHLAIVPNPRYEESVILTPEQFKAYNSQKEAELLKLANSKGEESMFNLFKKEKVANSAELEAMSVILPKSKKEMTVAEVITAFDAIQNMNGYANGDHMVKAGEEEMSVNDLASKYLELKNTMAAEAEEKKKNAEEEKKKADGEMVPNADDAEKKKTEEDEEKKKNADADAEKAKKNAHFEALKNAPLTVIKDEPKIMLQQDKLARGKELF